MSIATTGRPARELARRVSGGLEIRLLWSPHDNRTSVEIWHARFGETVRFSVAPERALEAFHHPFAHLPLAPDDVQESLTDA